MKKLLSKQPHRVSYEVVEAIALQPKVASAKRSSSGRDSWLLFPEEELSSDSLSAGMPESARDVAVPPFVAQGSSSASAVMPSNEAMHDCLGMFTGLSGFVGACVANVVSGTMLESVSVEGRKFPLSIAAERNSEVLRLKRRALEALGLEASIEDMLITLDSQYHLIRPSRLSMEFFFYIVLDRADGNLALARIALNQAESAFFVK